MGEIKLPMRMFLWSLAVIYIFAFASLYVQIPGLYGTEGILPARWQLRYTGKPLLEQLQDSPTLLWLCPRLGLDTQQGMELICVLGVLLAFGAMVLEPLRGSLVFFCLWSLYLSVYQVGQVFLYFQWDNLLLETGFLAVLAAPLNLFWSSSYRYHDNITFWLLRWLLFRLMFASGVVKLTSRCPTWWGLSALTYHYETQCIPTPLAWYAHQLPVWFQKLSVVATFVIEIPVPFLFFSPIRNLRLGAFYMQLLLQVLIILTGNYNFFNLLTIILCFSLLDDDHVSFWLRRSPKAGPKSWVQGLLSWGAFLLAMATYALIIYWTVIYFDLQINLEGKTVTSKTAFTYHQFSSLLQAVTMPSVWLGVLSLSWEVVKALTRCVRAHGIVWKMWLALQWTVFTSAAAGMFTVSLVPYSFIEYDFNSNIWASARKAYTALDRYQLVNSYGLFRRMTGLSGRPEVVIEGSMNRETWTEIEFMYKPGNMSGPPPAVTPHQPRLDWQMWFAALGPHTHSPWFPSLVYRLLQGKQDVIDLIQPDESQYPFNQQPPAYIRARLYKYWYTELHEDGSYPQQWWRRVYVGEFFPAVHLGDSALESLLSPFVLKEKERRRRLPAAPLPQALHLLRKHLRTLTGPQTIWYIFCSGFAISLLKALFFGSRYREPKPDSNRLKKGNDKDPQCTASANVKDDKVSKEMHLCKGEGCVNEDDPQGSKHTYAQNEPRSYSIKAKKSNKGMLHSDDGLKKRK